MQRYELFAPLYKYIDNICEMCTVRKKRIIIYGTAMGGRFLRHLIEEINGYRLIDMYIENKKDLYFTRNIYRSSILDYIDCSKYVLLNSALDKGDIYTKCKEYHFILGDNFFDARKDIGNSYLSYLQRMDPALDFAAVRIDDRPDLYKEQINRESTPFQDPSVESLFDAIDMLGAKNFFDYGCGKGQILLRACLRNYNKVGGIDLNKDCCETAKCNLKRLGFDAEISFGNAMTYQDIDDYNIFYLYNSFGEEVLRPVLHNIATSFDRRKRPLFLIYGNPFHHKVIMEESEFRIIKQIRVDLFDPILNIYSLR